MTIIEKLIKDKLIGTESKLTYLELLTQDRRGILCLASLMRKARLHFGDGTTGRKMVERHFHLILDASGNIVFPVDLVRFDAIASSYMLDANTIMYTSGYLGEPTLVQYDDDSKQWNIQSVNKLSGASHVDSVVKDIAFIRSKYGVDTYNYHENKVILSQCDAITKDLSIIPDELKPEFSGELNEDSYVVCVKYQLKIKNSEEEKTVENKAYGIVNLTDTTSLLMKYYNSDGEVVTMQGTLDEIKQMLMNYAIKENILKSHQNDASHKMKPIFQSGT